MLLCRGVRLLSLLVLLLLGILWRLPTSASPSFFLAVGVCPVGSPLVSIPVPWWPVLPFGLITLPDAHTHTHARTHAHAHTHHACTNMGLGGGGGLVIQLVRYPIIHLKRGNVACAKFDIAQFGAENDCSSHPSSPLGTSVEIDRHCSTAQHTLAVPPLEDDTDNAL